MRVKRRRLPLPKLKQAPPETRIISRTGQFNVQRIGQSTAYWQDLYHGLLTMRWPWLMALLFLIYIVANAGFALLYLAGGDGIENAEPGSFGDAFFFSVQTMASIGYGAMHPKTTYTDLVVTLEALVGLVGLAMGSGLMFARFSRPTARVLFSSVAVIMPFEGVPTLMFRAANQRRNQILEAQLRLTLVRDELNADGHFMRRFHDLALVRRETPIFALSWTLMHPITASSPLYEATPESLAASRTELIVTLTGLDDTFSQTVHARHSFTAAELHWNMRLADILTVGPAGERYVNYNKFHDILPLN